VAIDPVKRSFASPIGGPIADGSYKPGPLPSRKPKCHPDIAPPRVNLHLSPPIRHAAIMGSP